MKAIYRHLTFPKNKTFHIERFDKNTPCEHEGLHLHQGYEIVYVKNGNGTIKVADKEVGYSNGSLIFIGPSIPHFSFSNSTYEDNFEVVIHFDEDFVTHKISVFPELGGVLKLIENSKKVIVFDENIHKEQSSVFDKVIDLDTGQQLITVLGLLLNLSEVKVLNLVLDKSLGEQYGQNRQINKVFDYVNNNFQKAISTQDVANEVGLTTNSFCRMFKKTTGYSFISYLKDYRIYRAAKLIEESDDSISKIMQDCGFESPSYFAKVFAQIKNCSPGAYRNNIKSNSWNLKDSMPHPILKP